MLLCDGPAGLTSRTVTDEAGVAGGVLHRQAFADFNDFLAALVREQITTVDAVSADLRRAGSGTVVENLTAALLRLTRSGSRWSRRSCSLATSSRTPADGDPPGEFRPSPRRSTASPTI